MSLRRKTSFADRLRDLTYRSHRTIPRSSGRSDLPSDTELPRATSTIQYDSHDSDSGDGNEPVRSPIMELFEPAEPPHHQLENIKALEEEMKATIKSLQRDLGKGISHLKTLDFDEGEDDAIEGTIAELNAKLKRDLEKIRAKYLYRLAKAARATDPDWYATQQKASGRNWY